MNIAERPTLLVGTDEHGRYLIAPDIPRVKEAFQAVDVSFRENPEAYLERLEQSVFVLTSSAGGEITASLIHDEHSKPDEMMVIFAPFSDSAPKSTAEELYTYTQLEKPSFMQKEKAAPNSWSQTTKSAVTFELMKAFDNNMPVLTIYSPMELNAYTKSERKLIMQGDFTPAGRIAQEAIEQAQIRLHGKGGTDISTIRLSGGSLGAAKAIGAADSLQAQGRDIRSVSAQELVVGPRTAIDLLGRFTVRGMVGEPGSQQEYSDVISEPLLRRNIDKFGSESVGTNARMLQGMAKIPYMRGLLHPERTAEAVDRLLSANIVTLVAVAENSALSHESAKYLPKDNRLVVVRGNGEKIGHILNEHVALSALITTLSTRDRRGR